MIWNPFPVKWAQVRGVWLVMKTWEPSGHHMFPANLVFRFIGINFDEVFKRCLRSWIPSAVKASGRMRQSIH